MDIMDKSPLLTDREVDFGGHVGLVLVMFPGAILAPNSILSLIFIAIGVVFGYRAYQGYQLNERLDWSRAGVVTIVTFFSLLLFLKLITLGLK
jgi:predicted membrane metal-binding protein